MLGEGFSRPNPWKHTAMVQRLDAQIVQVNLGRGLDTRAAPTNRTDLCLAPKSQGHLQVWDLGPAKAVPLPCVAYTLHIAESQAERG